MGEQRTTRLLAWTVSSIVITMLVLSAVSWARVLDLRGLRMSSEGLRLDDVITSASVPLVDLARRPRR